jgi:hypothetical protein
MDTLSFDTNVKVDTIYGLPPRTRYGNIQRIKPVSILRIDFNSPIGSVKNSVLADVGVKGKSYGIK